MRLPAGVKAFFRLAIREATRHRARSRRRDRVSHRRAGRCARRARMVARRSDTRSATPIRRFDRHPPRARGGSHATREATRYARLDRQHSTGPRPRNAPAQAIADLRVRHDRRIRARHRRERDDVQRARSTAASSAGAGARAGRGLHAARSDARARPTERNVVSDLRRATRSTRRHRARRDAELPGGNGRERLEQHRHGGRDRSIGDGRRQLLLDARRDGGARAVDRR